MFRIGKHDCKKQMHYTILTYISAFDWSNLVYSDRFDYSK